MHGLDTFWFKKEDSRILSNFMKILNVINHIEGQQNAMKWFSTYEELAECEQ